MSEDSTISMAEEIAVEAALAHALAADEAGFLGDGTGAYHGVVGLANALAAGSVVTAAAGQNTAATITIAMFQEALGKLPEFAGINPAWFVSKPVWSNVMGRLQLALGGNNKEDLGQGPVTQFLGYPVVFSEVLPKTIGASTKFGYFGDLRMASTLGLRRNFELVGDVSRYFETDEIGFRSTMRWDYNVHERGDASNPGPILQLVSAS
jgi:HK97 family phage major capsid protein